MIKAIKPIKFKINNPDVEERVERVKRVKCETLITTQLKPSGRVLMASCPIHEDSNPSFAIFPETNSWYCFAGCGGGDVIDLYMRIHDCGFQEALRGLSDR